MKEKEELKKRVGTERRENEDCRVQREMLERRYQALLKEQEELKQIEEYKDNKDDDADLSDSEKNVIDALLEAEKNFLDGGGLREVTSGRAFEALKMPKLEERLAQSPQSPQPPVNHCFSSPLSTSLSSLSSLRRLGHVSPIYKGSVPNKQDFSSSLTTEEDNDTEQSVLDAMSEADKALQEMLGLTDAATDVSQVAASK